MTPPIPDVVDLLRDLVAVDTTNPGGDELRAAELLAELFDAHGVPAQVDTYADGHANLVATADLGGDGPTVMLNSHLDVVPAGGDWTSAPFDPELRDGRMYGRGSADAKGSLAPMAVAALRLLGSPASGEMGGRIVYTAVGDEEVGSGGARHLLTDNVPDAAIVGEPTGLRLLAAHKGSVRPVIEVRGVAAHAATPDAGVNAIRGLGPLLELLDQYSATLGRRSHPLTGRPTATPVLVEGGEAPNAVPAVCRVTLDRRLVPGETADQALAELDELLATYSREHAPFGASVVECAPSTGGPSETAETDPFVVACRAGLVSVGMDDRPGGLVVNCDMTHFRAAGVPTVVLGPGELEAMHVVDESIAVDDVYHAVEVYEAVLRHVLAVG